MKNLAFMALALVMGFINSFAQDVPERPAPARWINDIAGMLSGEEATALEASLSAIAEQAQVAVVTVNDLKGAEANAFADKIGQAWGIGDPAKENGIVLLVKNKTADAAGALSLRVGNGLSSVLPQETIDNIINNDLVSNFKNGDYAAGIKAAVGTIAKTFAEKAAAEAQLAAQKAAEQAAAAAPAVVEKAAEKGGIPTWVWIVLGVVVLGAIAFFVMKKK